jgi:hypothetical protein
MKKSLSFLAIAAAATVLMSLPSAAKAQVSVGVRGPHGAFSIGVGGPFVPQVGAYVPSPYVDEIYQGDDGYGFYYDGEWVPCEQYGSGWVIIERPVVYGRGYARPYGYGRAYGYGYARPYVNYGRRDGFVGRGGFDGRREFQGQGRREFQGQSRREFQGQGRREFQGQSGSQGRREFQGRQDRGSRSDGNRRSDRGGRRDGR